MSSAVLGLRGPLGTGVLVAALGLSVVAARPLSHAPASAGAAVASAAAPTHGTDGRPQSAALRFALARASMPLPVTGATRASAKPRPAAAPVRKATAAAPAKAHPTSAYPRLTWWSTGPYVTRVQRILGLPQTGVFGRRTHTAVVQFQRAHHIAPADGVVGASTWSVLRRVKPAKAAATPTKTATATATKAAVAAPTRIATAPSDPTMTATMRSSRSARLGLGLTRWQSSGHGRMIAQRESSGRCTAVSPGGTYRGKWQMSATLWKGYGGTAFAASADKATCAQQDLVAYRVWVTSWWMPWGG